MFLSLNFQNQPKSKKDLVAESIKFLPDQIADVLKQSKKIKIPANYKKVNRIVLNGMGGSNLGARIIAAVFKDELKIPLIVESGYEVPKFVDKNTLYIISSYSGNTEEPLSTYQEAKKRGAKILALTGLNQKNKLAELMKKEKVPGFIFSDSKNPSRLPRLGLGYAIFALVVLLEKVGVLKIKPEEISRVLVSLKKNNSKISIARTLAKKIFGREAMLIGAEFLEGNLHTLRNQFCETGKNFASYLMIPDMNHYFLEGLANPVSNKKNLAFLFFESTLFHKRVQKRISLAEKVVEQNGIKVLKYKLSEPTKLGQAFELLQFGSYLAASLAVLNKVNPAKTPWVDWFKKQLK